MRQKIKLLFLILIIGFSSASIARSAIDKLTCPDANIFGVNLIKNICWSCMYPLKISGLGEIGSKYRRPPGAASALACACKDENGVPAIGVPVGFFEPARLVEIVKKPYCSPSLGGISMQDKKFQLSGGNEESTPDDELDGNSALSFYNYHYFSFPLFQMLSMAGLPGCVTDGFLEMDMMDISELNPTWNDEEIGFFLNPEALLYNNPVSSLACIGDCVLSSANKPSEELFWCAGCWGNLTPMSGYFEGKYTSLPQASSLLTARAVNLLHRTGRAYKTYGKHMIKGQCKSKFWPVLPKSQYKMSMIYPFAQAENTLGKRPAAAEGGESGADSDSAASTAGTNAPTDLTDGDNITDEHMTDMNDMRGVDSNCCNVIGKNTFLSGIEWKTYPGKGESFVYMLWRYKDCCTR